LRVSRREFILGVGMCGAGAATSAILPALFAGAGAEGVAGSLGALRASADKSPFRVAVINDEITQDFGRACEVAAREFGMGWIELRGMWRKNILNLDAKEVEESRRILEKYGLRVTDIASPLFKVDWSGAPKSKFSPKRDQFSGDFTFDQQDEVLERSIELAKAFQTDRVRCFDFWRLDDQAPYRQAIDAKLEEAAAKAGKKNVTLLLENEPACNTATGAESVAVLAAVKSPHLMLNWDPGNAATHGEKVYPDAYERLPKNRIGHVHCKNASQKTDGKGYQWEPVGRGVIDWAGQFSALKRDGYHYAVSLETHWHGGGTPEESTRQSWAGMKEALEKAGAL